jgi:hypothetical protein
MSRSFLLRLVVFAVPVAILLLLPVSFAAYMGEAMPLRMVIGMQTGNTPVLYGPADRDPVFAYKLLSVQMRHPEVLVIGSSRVLQFRARLLTRQPTVFFNAAGEGWGLGEVRALVEHLDASSAPRVLLLGIDQPWFNADYETWEAPHNLTPLEFDPQRAIAATRKVIDELSAEDIRLATLLARDEWVRGGTGLGLFALQFGRGYRNDGSFQQGELVRDPNLGELGRTNDLQRAPEGWRQFVKGNRVSDAMLAELDELLRLTASLDMVVIGFSSPFTPSIYRVMLESGEHDYLTQSAPMIRAVFERHGFYYFDFSNAEWIGGAEVELYDGWHPTELLSLRMFMAMQHELPAILDPYADLAVLEQIAETAANPIEVFGNLP